MRTPYRAISVIMLLALTLILGVSAVRAVKTTVFICHATNDPGHFNLLEVDDNALAGHRVGDEFHINRKTGEQDYFASEGEIAQDACGPVVEATPTPTPDGDPEVTPTPAPSFVPCEEVELQIPELTECPDPSETPVPSPTSSIDVPATMTPTPVPTASDIPNTGLPYMVDEGNHENDFNWFAFLLIAGSMGWMIQRAVEAKKESE